MICVWNFEIQNPSQLGVRSIPIVYLSLCTNHYHDVHVAWQDPGNGYEDYQNSYSPIGYKIHRCDQISSSIWHFQSYLDLTCSIPCSTITFPSTQSRMASVITIRFNSLPVRRNIHDGPRSYTSTGSRFFLLCSS